jgi:hypothetical protein
VTLDETALMCRGADHVRDLDGNLIGVWERGA